MTNIYTAVRLKQTTKERLSKIGSKGETYDDIIIRLLEEHERDKQRSIV